MYETPKSRKTGRVVYNPRSSEDTPILLGDRGYLYHANKRFREEPQFKPYKAVLSTANELLSFEEGELCVVP
jgi:hypothetical protein